MAVKIMSLNVFDLFGDGQTERKRQFNFNSLKLP